MLTYLRLLRAVLSNLAVHYAAHHRAASHRAPRLRSLLSDAPRTLLVKPPAMAVLSAVVVAATVFSVVPGTKSAPVATANAAVVGGAALNRASAGGDSRASRDEQRGAPSATPAQSSAPAAAAPAAAAPATPAAPAAPATPAIPVVSGLDQYQAENAQTIVKVGTQMGVSTRGKVIAIATALQESKLYNLDVAVDYDSLGLFQQRPSTGWGRPDQLTTPTYAAQAFYARLLDTQADWGCLTCAAQRVQGSAFPDAYAQHEGFADAIVAALGG